MPPPSSLQIATSALQRLVKEESSYHKELEHQQARIQKLEDQVKQGTDAKGEEGNNEFLLGQERRAVEETKAVLPDLHKRIDSSIEALESQLESYDGGNEAEVQKAKDVLTEAKSRRAAA